jgi:LytS/YehU family sensor histidine kinase
VDFEVEAMPATGQIAPLLLLPLVENAFKHGAAEQVGRATIRIALAVQGTAFSCLIVNSKNAGEAAPPGPAGIGLRNVRQRLQLLYPQRHRLEVEARPDTFTVRLTLQLPGPALATAAAPAGPLAAMHPAGPALFVPSALPAHENAA